MFKETSFMKTQNILEMGLNNSVLRRKVLADNIANVDVPHFKRSEVTFEANLQRAIQSEENAAKEQLPTQISDERHIHFFKPKNYQDVKSRVNIDYLTTMRADGNNVDVEKEMVTAARNQMSYSILITRINQNFRDLHMVMKQA